MFPGNNEHFNITTKHIARASDAKWIAHCRIAITLLFSMEGMSDTQRRKNRTKRRATSAEPLNTLISTISRHKQTVQ
jgi:hypothetical protein